MPVELCTIAEYIRPVFAGDLTSEVEKFEKRLSGVDFDTIVGIGLSGALIVPFLGRATGKNWGIIRKDDGSHSSSYYEGTLGQRWIFVDDQVCSGRTLSIVLNKMKDHVKRNAKPADFTAYVGTYTYLYDGSFGRRHADYYV